MKVKELIEILNKYDEKHEIFIAIDPEGNRYNDLYDVSEERLIENEIEEDGEANSIVLWP